jgi:hypothetical protein
MLVQQGNGMPPMSSPRPLPAALLLFACLAGALPSPATAAIPIPEPPADRAHRFGVYAWGFDTAAYPAGPVSPDRLNWAADKVAGTGSRTIRVYLGARDDYKVNPTGILDDGLYLARLVGGGDYPTTSTETAYDRLFQDPRFDTYLLTVYSPGDDQNNWVDGLSDFEAALERDQIGRLGDLLLERYPQKTFLLLNWEGDNALGGHLDDPVAWEGFSAWIAARAAGGRDAQGRHANPGTAVRLFSGLEFNRLHRNGAWCGSDGSLAQRCVIDFVAPGADVDYYSYSSWETLSTLQLDPTISLAAQIRTDLGHALALVQRSRLDVTPSRFLLGEAGFARTAPRIGECRAADQLRELVQAVEGTALEPAFGLSYAIFWQVLDNPSGPGGTPQSFGLYRAIDGGFTVPGVTLRALLTGTHRALPVSCPRFRDCADPADNSCAVGSVDLPWELPLRLVAGESLALTGSGFSPLGNTVTLLQGPRRFTLRSGSPGWRESPERIEIRLPESVPMGQILLWVTDARGLDSNGEILTVVPRLDPGDRDKPSQ